MDKLPTSASQLFDEVLPALLSEHAAKAKEVGVVYAFKVTGEGGGEWTVDLKGKIPDIQKGLQAGAGCVVEMAHQDLLTALANPSKFLQMFLAGKVKVTSGDPMLLMKLQRLLELA